MTSPPSLLQVADFGLSRTREQTFASGTCNVGTPQYAAPEMLRSERHGEAADVWSYGVTLYEICTNLRPYANHISPMQVALAPR